MEVFKLLQLEEGPIVVVCFHLSHLILPSHSPCYCGESSDPTKPAFQGWEFAIKKGNSSVHIGASVLYGGLPQYLYLFIH